MSAWQVWGIVALLFFVLEITMVGTFAIFFAGIGALGTALLCLFLTELMVGIPTQLLFFSVITMASLFLIRRPMLLAIHKKSAAVDPANDHYGRRARVLVPISRNGGRVSYRGTEWQAQLMPDCDQEDVPEGSTVYVRDFDGLILLVDTREDVPQQGG